MIGIVFTLDYEIHGNGDGSPYSLMIEPTQRLLASLESYGAKLTIMPDVAEILKFKEYAVEYGRDDFYSAEIEAQLQGAIQAGHDVQLHIHSSYCNSKYKNKTWQQDWSEYNLAKLPYDRIFEIIQRCKSYLEELLLPVSPDYRCSVFRAANWCMSPTANIARALIANNISIDTSVFKYGRRKGLVSFDYENAQSAAIPWPIDCNNVCNVDQRGKLFEFPIYCEKRKMVSFLSFNRVFRLLQASRHRFEPVRNEEDSSLERETDKKSLWKKLVSPLMRNHAWKLDFNQCSGKQLISGLINIEQKYGHLKKNIPAVLIGHPKLYNGFNERTLKQFLDYIVNNKGKYFFATFNAFDLKDHSK